MDGYVTDALLEQTSCNTAYPDWTLRCVVRATVPLRTCEFSDEKVFTAVASISPSTTAARGSAAGVEADVVRVNFYGLWGMAAAFLDPGDVILLHGFYRLDVPCTPAEFQGNSAAAAGGSPASTAPASSPPSAPLQSVSASPSSSSARVICVCPLPEEEGCVLRVLQPGKGGDVMEVLVSPSNMDAICMRGLTASDEANHRYVRQCVASAAVPQE